MVQRKESATAATTQTKKKKARSRIGHDVVGWKTVMYTVCWKRGYIGDTAPGGGVDDLAKHLDVRNKTRRGIHAPNGGIKIWMSGLSHQKRGKKKYPKKKSKP